MAMWSLEDLKPKIQDALQYLNASTEFAAVEAFDALHVINQAALHCTEPPSLGLHMLDCKFGDLFLKLWKDLSKYISKIEERESQGFTNVMELMAAFINLTDESPELCIELGKIGSIGLLIQTLEDIEESLYQDIDLKFADRLLGMLHNCIRLTSENRTIFRQVNAVSTLKNCVKSNNILIQVDCLMILAYIVDDKEREILATSEKGLKLLLGLLKQSVNAEDHSVHCGDSDFTAHELMDVINLLAINDVNKVEMEKSGVIPHIVRMLEDGFEVNEQRIAAETLWNLCFVDSIRQSETLQNTVPLLEKLLASEDKDLRGASASALWQLRGGSVSATPSTTAPPGQLRRKESLTTPANIKTPAAQLMISYQWDMQQRATEIRNRLVASGYQVWMDITNMKGDILEAMADGVQKSDVILLCMTEKYKDSQSCRAEATYAYKLKKKMIPLLLEKGYKPDGWLGLMQGMDLYYSFHPECQLVDSMNKLLRAIGDSTSCDSTDGSEVPIVAKKEEISRSAPPPSQQSQQSSNGTSSLSAITSRANSIKKWTTENVQQWLRRVGLSNLCETLDFCDGRHLKKLHARFHQDHRCEDRFRSDFNVDARTCLHFTVELDTLFED